MRSRQSRAPETPRAGTPIVCPEAGSLPASTLGKDTVTALICSGDDRAAAALASTRTALVFFAHPDDVDFGAGGTIAALTAEGARVVYVVMTDGDAGGFSDEGRESIAETRHEEQRRAAAPLGGQRRSTAHQIGGDGLHGITSDRHDALLVTLAEQPHRAHCAAGLPRRLARGRPVGRGRATTQADVEADVEVSSGRSCRSTAVGSAGTGVSALNHSVASGGTVISAE